ncbi:MAG: hypothetical protein FJ189_09500 [Gammaproteobacteria bacterium]|nr:hypothetical protein [Gammaproteobacteria bacterium]
MLRLFRTTCWLVLSVLILSACGQKGPLYLPRPDENPEQRR